MNYDRIILELMDRVATLEEEIEVIKNKSIISSSIKETNTAISQYNERDTTKYILDGIRYCKNRLVLAVVKKYISENPDMTASQLMLVFDRSLQGSLGVIRIFDEVKNNYLDYERRFFCKTREIIHTSTEDCVVCTQWGAFNIGNIIARAKELGINITTI